MLLFPFYANAQTHFKVAENLYSSLPVSLANRIIFSLDALRASIDNGRPDTTLIGMNDVDLNYIFFANVKGIESKDTVKKYFHAQLINIYPVANKQVILTVYYTKDDEIGRIHNFLEKENNNRILFFNPLQYNARHWKTTTIGTITYFFRDTIDTKRAKMFNEKNISMAKELNLPVRNWEICMCRNFQ